MHQIIVKPIISERSMRDAATGRFTFQVATWANKNQISLEVAKAFNVHPMKISTLIVKGENKRSAKSRNLVKQSSVKKAIITLKAGEKIDLFDVTEKPHEGQK